MLNNKEFVASWSGGKDSAMAYYRALKAGAVPKKLWTMFEEDQKRSKSHALPMTIIQAQAKQLGIPSMISGVDWAGYEEQFLRAMKSCVEEGISYGVFGDIDLEDHLEWVRKTCEKVGMQAVHPLWMEPRRKILEEFLAVGFVAYVIVIDAKRVPAEFIGRQFTIELMDELEALGIDSCGESGEFHTVVVDGPIFKERLPIKFGEVMIQDNYHIMPVALED